MEALGCKNGVEGGGNLAVIVMDQEAQSRLLGPEFPYQLSGLLGDPLLIGVSCDPGEMNTAGTQFDEEKNVKSLQPEGLDCKEIAGQDLFLVVGHELAPPQGAVADWCRDDVVAVEYSEWSCGRP